MFFSIIHVPYTSQCPSTEILNLFTLHCMWWYTISKSCLQLESALAIQSNPIQTFPFWPSGKKLLNVEYWTETLVHSDLSSRSIWFIQPCTGIPTRMPFLALICFDFQLVTESSVGIDCLVFFSLSLSCWAYAFLIYLNALIVAYGVWVMGSKYLAGNRVTGQYCLTVGFTFFCGKQSL